MSDAQTALVGVIAGILNICGTIPYVRDIFRHKTKPERAMWWVYAVLFSVLFFAQFDSDAGWLLLITGSYIISAALIAILSVKYGYGSFHKRDTISLAIAALGLIGWWITDSALVAIILVIVIDFAGFWLTLVKTWAAPHSETLIAWQLSLVSALLSLLSIQNWSFAVWIYPVYAVLAVGLIVWLIMYRRTKVSEDIADA